MNSFRPHLPAVNATWSDETRLVAYLAFLVSASLACALGLVAAGYEIENLWLVLALGGVAALAERSSVRLSSNLEESISLFPALFAAVLIGPLAAMVVFSVSMLGDLRRPYMKWAVYTCSRSITGALTGVVALSVGALASSHLGAIALGATAGVLVAVLSDLAFASATMLVRGNGVPREMIRTIAPSVFAAVPIYAPAVTLLAYAHDELSAWSVLLFLAPALAAQRLFILYQEQRQLAGDLSLANLQLEQANFSFAAALVATLDARDQYTAGHSTAVAVYARDIAARIGLPEETQRRAHLAGLVHDIGKVGLPPGLLEKTGPLTLEERCHMELHSSIAERILRNVDDYAEIATVVRHHHERSDGEGYPDKLRAQEIPLLSRIIAVADAYNAMTSHRPYRDAMPSRVARMRLAQAVDTQFDASVVAAFEAILADATEEYRHGFSAEFALASQDAYDMASRSFAAVAA